jgi:hypothetical protein
MSSGQNAQGKDQACQSVRFEFDFREYVRGYEESETFYQIFVSCDVGAWTRKNAV